MTKYMNRPPITPGQEKEIFPLLDAALQLPYGKAIAYKCAAPRGDYLARVANGERYRNAIMSISTYLPDDPLYGKGLYYNLVIEPHPKGVVIANVENPPSSITWLIIQCAAFKKPINVRNYPIKTVQSRLGRIRERFPEEIGPVYLEITSMELRYAIPSPEEMVVVDIDLGGGTVSPPTDEQRAKIRQ